MLTYVCTCILFLCLLIYIFYLAFADPDKLLIINRKMDARIRKMTRLKDLYTELNERLDELGTAKEVDKKDIREQIDVINQKIKDI